MFILLLREKGLPKQPGRSASTANAVALWIAGTEELISRESCHVMEYGTLLYALFRQI